MQLSELRTELIAMADDPDITNSQANNWINSAYRLLLQEYEWPFMVGTDTYTVTSGTAEQTFAGMDTGTTDFSKSLRVWIANSSTDNKSQMKPIHYEERFENGVTNSYYITPDNLSIGLVPTPTNSTNVVTVDFLKSTTDLSADGDVPVFHSDFHWLLIWRPVLMYQKREREVSDEYEVMYQELLQAMVKFYKMPQAATNPVLSRGTTVEDLPSDSPFKRR